MRMTEILAIDDLHSFYGDFQALHGVSLSLDQGQVMALFGANGAGKSRLLKSICGLGSVRAGSVRWKGADLRGQSPNRIVRQGIAMVPKGRRLFPSLSVEENLIIGGQVARKGPWTLRAVYDLFPLLAEKRAVPATSLSGGQQQMVSIGRALMSNPELILLDEMSLGLAPIVIKDIYAQLPRITASGMSALLVEQDATRALSAYVALVVVQMTGLHTLLALILVVPLLAGFGYGLQRITLNRTLGKDLLPPLLVTFGLSVILQNGLLEVFTADSRKLSAGALEVGSFKLGDAISVGYLPLLMFAPAVAVIAGLQFQFYRTALGRAFRATSDDAEIAQLYGVGQTPCLCDGDGVLFGRGGDCRRISGDTVKF